MLAFVLHPEVVRKAHAQLDAVVGRDRFPTFNDQAQLTYIEAIVRELMRWRPVGPVGLPRSSTQVPMRSPHPSVRLEYYLGRLVWRAFYSERRVPVGGLLLAL